MKKNTKIVRKIIKEYITILMKINIKENKKMVRKNIKEYITILIEINPKTPTSNPIHQNPENKRSNQSLVH